MATFGLSGVFVLSTSPAHARPSKASLREASGKAAELSPGSEGGPSQIRLYVNGILQGATNFSGGWRAAGHSEIGRGFFAGKPVDFLNGNILDARAYGRALSTREIHDLYRAGPDPRWQFDRTGSPLTGENLQNQGTFLGGAEWLPGYSEGALNLNGTSACVDIHKGVLDTSKSYTVSAWVRLKSLNGFQTFVSQDGVNLSGFYLQKRGDDNKFALCVRTEDAPDAKWVTAESTFVPQVNVRYHVVAVYSKRESPTWFWDPARQGRFILSLCQDQQGRTWVGTEGQGAWRFDPRAASGQQWTQFTHSDGLGDDNVYALCCDRKGRVWAGTLNHGISVFNGQQWRTYDQASGPLGVRVFAITSCPTDGDVWAATEAGLARYHLASDVWTYYTHANGLPADGATALAFNRKGDLFVGTGADGLAIGSAISDYCQWHTVKMSEPLPRSAGGAGLPSNLINCLLVATSGAIYCGTDGGLARSEDDGKSWRFLRGQDWSAKAASLPTRQTMSSGLVHSAQVNNGFINKSPITKAHVSALEIWPLPNAFANGFPASRKHPQSIKPISVKPIRIAAGSIGRGAWAADRFFEGGSTFHSSGPIDTRATADPAPQSVYQSGRWGNFAYTVPNLQPEASFRVRLYFVGTAGERPGQDVFNVGINDHLVLSRFDNLAEAGAKNKVIVKEFIAQADAQGRMKITFQGTPLLPGQHSPYELAEDYVTCLTEASLGVLLIGHRQQGVEAVSMTTGKRLFPGPRDSEPTDYAMALLPLQDGTTLIGGYGNGVMQQLLPAGIAASSLLTFRGQSSGSATTGSATMMAVAPLPAPAGPPSLAELNASLRTVSAVSPDAQEMTPKATALDDDWLTEGDWLGRYGRYWACLCALCSPSDYLWGAGWEPVSYAARTGSDVRPGDSLRYWVATNYATDAYCLELPPTYLDSRIQKGLTTQDVFRRQAEYDDHGETYPMSQEGPSLYYTVAVPKGLYYLSLYEDNYSAQAGFWRGLNYGPQEKRRDLRLSLRPHPANHPLNSLDEFSSQSEWAHGRVVNFRYGVWKRFLVRGPVTLTVEVNRNNSFNTILPAVMLDLVDEKPAPYFQSVAQWETLQEQREGQRMQALLAWTSGGGVGNTSTSATSEAEAANRLFDALEERRVTNSVWWATEGRRYYAMLGRWYAAQTQQFLSAPSQRLYERLGTCDYQSGQYANWEHCQQIVGLTPAREIEKSLRWDGISDAGQGYQVVTAYLAASKDHARGQVSRSTAPSLGVEISRAQ